MNRSFFFRILLICCILLAVTVTSVFAQFGFDEILPPVPVRKPIGVILPLSGKWKPVGEKMLKGIQLASGVFTQGDTPMVEYIIRDYASDESRIPAIIEELDKKHHVLAIIGPVGGAAGDITCKQNQARGIPTIIFTQSGLSPVVDSWCFGNFLTIYTQNRTLLDAATAMGITRFAICYPTDQFGEAYTQSFEQLAMQYGVQVIKKQAYDPKKNDFKDMIEGLKDSSIEALLIPDSPTNAIMIASYLSFFDIDNVRLFGPSLWDDPNIVKQGGTAVQGAIFASGFYPESSRPEIQSFTAQFKANFAADPTIWEASAYDTAIILQQIVKENINSRLEMRAGITSIYNFAGVTGRTTFMPDGMTRKDVFTLTIRGSRIRELTP